MPRIENFALASEVQNVIAEQKIAKDAEKLKEKERTQSLFLNDQYRSTLEVELHFTCSFL